MKRTLTVALVLAVMVASFGFGWMESAKAATQAERIEALMAEDIEYFWNDLMQGSYHREAPRAVTWDRANLTEEQKVAKGIWMLPPVPPEQVKQQIQSLLLSLDHDHKAALVTELEKEKTVLEAAIAGQ